MAGYFSEGFKTAWDSTVNDFMKFDRQEPKTFCQIKEDVVIFIAYVPDAFILRKANVEGMSYAAWSAVQEVQRAKRLPPCPQGVRDLARPGLLWPAHFRPDKRSSAANRLG